ncbi:right-handed parallel beta-helix repeat-containing protein [Paenibacillus sp. GCM10023248]|uniref:right-handed parallel beta-helix repeat-containing protein n=1 Tax=unclassified Paenibacillus TaxID=185978 RepID=UPI002378C66E|nr:right-handed parallel beta-helix repeat-containing protein [Paenibacillus sp. MAHUQ-63]MDD9266520.1 hypothetical protein [Paenibacillus sp. MAHUQ-63]
MAKIQVTTALKANLPVLSEGEFCFCTDTGELFIGAQQGNVQLGTIQDIGIKSSQLDSTNWAEGKTLEVDSNGKLSFVDKPTVITSLSDLSDVDLTSAPPLNGSVLQFDNGNWKTANLAETSSTTNSSIYIIELGRWGINNDGTNGAKTTQGINNAIVWAKANSYQQVILPQGTYLIDKNSSVKLLSNTIYTFYGCVFIKEANNLTGYNVLLCDSISNVVIQGATIKGDRESHIYTSGSTHEWGYGIESKNSCYNIVVKDCDVSECTGDGFTTSMDFSAIGGAQHPGHFAKGDIDTKGNVDSTKVDYTTVTKFFDVTGDLVKSEGYFYYSGDGYGGYGTGSNLNKTVIKVHFYKTDGSYLGFRTTRSYEFIYLDSLPVGTTKVRFSFPQNYDAMNGNLHYVMCAKIPQYIDIVNCKLHKNRRLGASVGGGRFVTFDSCEIYDNSNPMSISSGTNPGYGVDIEDGYMANQKITFRNCNFYDNRAGALICVSTRGVYLENNKFRGNVNLSGSGDDYLSLNNMYYGSITGRSITSGTEADGTFCTFRNDSVFNGDCSINAGNTTLENCVFSKSNLILSGETAKIINCKLTFDDPNRAAIGFTSKNTEVYNSVFDIRRSGPWAAAYNSSENVIFSNVKFITNLPGGSYAGGNYVGTKNLVVSNCEFIHLGTSMNYSGMTVSESMLIENSTFKNQSLRIDGGGLFSSEKLAADPGYVTHAFKNNKIIWDVPFSSAVHETRGPGVSFSYIPRLEVSNNKIRVIDQGVALGQMYTLRIFTENQLTLSNNSITTANYSGTNTMGTITIEGAYRIANSVIPKPKSIIVVQNNSQVNSAIVFTSNVNMQLEKNILGNILMPSLASSVPSFGSYSVGELLYNTAPAPGGYIGWVCVTAGTANNNSWTQNKAYSINDLVNANGKVYRATTAGTSGTIPPSHTTGVANDGGVSWAYVNGLAVFKPFGLISN